MLKITQYKALLENIKNAFRKMDLQYKIVSEQYGFKCNGCENNCCSTLFYHYTLLEYLYVNEGLNALQEKQRYTIRKKAISNNKKLEHDSTLRIMCPLNIKNLCIIYEHRPMICRLHGIPHQFNYATYKVNVGTGCHKFKDFNIKSNTKRLDRTSHYKELASLELKTRKIFGFNEKIKMTVSEMVTKRYFLE